MILLPSAHSISEDAVVETPVGAVVGLVAVTRSAASSADADRRQRGVGGGDEGAVGGHRSRVIGFTPMLRQFRIRRRGERGPLPPQVAASRGRSRAAAAGSAASGRTCAAWHPTDPAKQNPAPAERKP